MKDILLKFNSPDILLLLLLLLLFHVYSNNNTLGGRYMRVCFSIILEEVLRGGIVSPRNSLSVCLH